MKKFRKWLQMAFLVWSLRKQIKDIYNIIKNKKNGGVDYNLLIKSFETLINEILGDIKNGNYEYLKDATKRLDKAKLYIKYPAKVPPKEIHLLRQKIQIF